MCAGWVAMIPISPIRAGAAEVWARPAYLRVGSSEGTGEEQELLDGSLSSSSCSPGSAVAKAPVWCDPFAWCSTYHVSIEERRGPHPHYTQMTLISSDVPPIQTHTPPPHTHRQTTFISHMKPHRNRKHPKPHPIAHKSGWKVLYTNSLNQKITPNCSLARKESCCTHAIQLFKQTGCTSVSKDHSDLCWL